MKTRKHIWSQAPGDTPCIGFMPECLNCGASADTDTKTCAEYRRQQQAQFERDYLKYKERKNSK